MAAERWRRLKYGYGNVCFFSYLSILGLLIFFFFFNFVYFETEGENMHAREEETRERKRERIPTRLCAVSAEPNVGLDLTNHEIMTSAEIKSQMLNRLSHPGIPDLFKCVGGGGDLK